MKLHLFLTSTAKGNLNLDKKLIETSNLFKDAKKISRSHIEGIQCIEIEEPLKKDIKLIKVGDKKVDIPIHLNFKAFETLSFSYLDICLDISADNMKEFIDIKGSTLINTVFADGRIFYNNEEKSFDNLIKEIFLPFYDLETILKRYNKRTSTKVKDINLFFDDLNKESFVDIFATGFFPGLDLSVGWSRLCLIEDFNNEIELANDWECISKIDGQIYEHSQKHIRICKNKDISKACYSMTFIYKYKRHVLAYFLSCCNGWLDAIKGEVHSIRDHVANNSTNAYYWRELKKKIEILDLNFLEFNVEAGKWSNSSFDYGLWNFKKEYAKEKLKDYNDGTQKLNRQLNEVRHSLRNLSTPGHTHDEQILQEETEKVNERILMLSFIAMSIPTFGAIITPGIDIVVKISAGVAIFSLPVIYYFVRKIQKQANFKRYKKIEKMRVIDNENKSIESAKKQIKLLEHADKNSDINESILKIFKQELKTLEDQVEKLKNEL